MSELKFDANMARLQQALAQCHDMVVRRTTMMDLLNLRTGENVLEFGCGGGFYAYEAAQFVGSTGRVCGIDVSEDQISAARERCKEFSHVDFKVANILGTHFSDNEFDAAFGVQVLEYVPDLDQAISEVGRILRPGGRFLVLSTNWSSVVWHSENEERMKRVLDVWAKHAPYPDLPAILPTRLRANGFQVSQQVPVPIINAVYGDSSFSRWAATMVKSYVANQGVLPRAEVEDWANEFSELEQSGAYWFSSTPIVTEAIKMVSKA